MSDTTTLNNTSLNDTPLCGDTATSSINKHECKYKSMVEQFKDNRVDIDILEEGPNKTIIIGIQEALDNEKLIAAGQALFVNYKLVRLFSPIIFKLYMKATKKHITQTASI